MDLGKDMQALAKKVARFIDDDVPKIIANEGLNHIEESFQNEGFTDTSLSKWKERKTTDKQGRDITRYRTNRRGRRGRLTAYGKKLKDRPILTGFNTGNNKLRNSFRAKTRRGRVVFFTYKKYAQKHNEGEGITKRQFIGQSDKLDDRIEKKITKTLDRIFK